MNAGRRRRKGSGTEAQQRFDAIIGEMRDRICMLVYEPGERLSEEDLAEEFGVSRTPVRRVISRLEAEGLLETRQGHGTFVTTADPDSLERLYELRMELACLAGRLLPKAPTPADLDAVRAILARCERAGDVTRRDYLQINKEFSTVLCGLVGNEHLRQVIETLYYQSLRVWLNAIPDSGLQDELATFRQEVAEVLRALEFGDVETVGHIRRNHMGLSLHRMRRYAAATGPDGEADPG